MATGTDLTDSGFIDIGQRISGDLDQLRLADYLHDSWLPHIQTRVRPRTILRYRQLLDGHVIPRIGDVPLGRLRPLHVQGVIDQMLATGSAPRTTMQAYRTLHSALRQAVRWELVTTNVAALVQPPRAERPRLHIPAQDAVTRILAATRGTRLYVPLVLAATTGMRRGEVLAMRWSSVDLEAGRATVTSSLQHIDGDLRFLDPKTDRSRRPVAIPASTIAILKLHRKDQVERRIRLGAAWTDWISSWIEATDNPCLPIRCRALSIG